MTQKAPYKGLGAESEEKREPVSDIDTGVVVSLKVLDPDGRLEKRTNSGHLGMSLWSKRVQHVVTTKMLTDQANAGISRGGYAGERRDTGRRRTK